MSVEVTVAEKEIGPDLLKEIEILLNKCLHEQYSVMGDKSPSAQLCTIHLNAQEEQEIDSATIFRDSVREEQLQEEENSMASAEKATLLVDNLLENDNKRSSELSLDQSFEEVTPLQRATSELRSVLSENYSLSPKKEYSLPDAACAGSGEIHFHQLAASTYGGFILTGKNAKEVLERALTEINGESESSLCVIALNGELVSSLNGIRLEAYINAVVLDANKLTQNGVILVLESFQLEQIVDLYESNFVREAMQVQPQLVNVIFLNPFLENGEYLSYTEQIIAAPEFRISTPNELLVSSDSDNESGNAYDEDCVYANSATIRRYGVVKPEMFAEDAVAAQMRPIIEEPVYILNYKGMKKDLQHDQEMGQVEHAKGDTFGTPSNDFERKFTTGTVQLMDPEKGNLEEEPRLGWFIRLANLMGDLIAQCGDCCFY